MIFKNISNFLLIILPILFFNSCSKLQNINDEEISFEYTKNEPMEKDDYIRESISKYKTEISDFYNRNNNFTFKPFIKIKKIANFSFDRKSDNITSSPSNIIIINDHAYYVDGDSNFNKYNLIENKLIYQKNLANNSNNISILPTSIAKLKNNFYISFSNGKIMKIDNEGNIYWEKFFNDLLRTPIKLFNDNILLIFNSNTINLIKSDDGEILWEYNYKLDKPSLSKGGVISIYDNLLFFIMPNGIIGAIDLIVGEPREYNFLQEIVQKNLLNYNYNASIYIYNNFLSFIEDKNTLYTYDITNNKFILFNEKIYFIKSFLFLNNALIVLSKKNELKTYNLINKNLYWKTDLSKYLSKKDNIIDSIVYNKTIIVFFSTGKIIHLDKITGEILFNQNLHLSDVNLITVQNQYILFNQNNGKVLIYKQ